MQIGFFTAALTDRPIEEVAHFAAQAGFTALEIEVGKHIGDLSRAPAVIVAARREGVEVCALACGPSLVNADKAAQGRTRATVEAAVDAALETGVGLVVTFPGRDESLSDVLPHERILPVRGSLPHKISYPTRSLSVGEDGHVSVAGCMTPWGLTHGRRSRNGVQGVDPLVRRSRTMGMGEDDADRMYRRRHALTVGPR